MSGKQQIVNNGKSYMNGAINDSVLLVNVSDGSRFPTSDFYIVINEEIMYVTSNVSHAFTVVRGQGGSVAASHTDGSVVVQALTADGLQRHIQDNAPMFGNKPCCITNRLGLMEDINGNPLSLSSLTWVNQGTAVASDYESGGVYIKDVGNVSTQVRLLKRTAPATPYKLTCAVKYGTGAAGATNLTDGNKVGIMFRESATSKLAAICYRGNSNYLVRYYTSPTAFSSDPVSSSWIVNGMYWYQLENDGVNLYYRRSIDGVNFIQFSTTLTAHFTTAPDEIGIFIDNSVNDSPTQAGFLSWIEE